MKSLVDYCKGPGEKQCQNQGHGHMVRRRSEALWEDGGIVGGVRHYGRMGRSEAFWEEKGTVEGERQDLILGGEAKRPFPRQTLGFWIPTPRAGRVSRVQCWHLTPEMLLPQP